MTRLTSAAKGWPPVSERDPIQTARNLTGALDGVRTELVTLNKRVGAAEKLARTLRRLTVGLFASHGVDLILTIVIAFVAVQARHADGSALAAREVARVAAHDNKALCLSGNKSRAQQLGAWTYLITLARASPDRQQQINISKFEQRLRLIYAPRDCTHISSRSP